MPTEKKTANKSLEYLTYLCSEEGKDELDDVCKKIVGKMKKEDGACKDYFNSKSFTNTIAKLKAHLAKTNKALMVDEYVKNNVIRGVSNDRFFYIFKTIFAELSDRIYSADFDYSNENIEFEGIVFTQIHGQGTHCEMALVKDSRFPPE